MKQGEIFLADLEPTVDNEQGGIRPAVIVSGNTMNDNFKLVWAVPLTSQMKNFPCDYKVKKAEINSLKTDSEALTFQIRTLAKSRLKHKIGALSAIDLKMIIRKINQLLYY